MPTNLYGVILASVGVISLIAYMFKALTPTNRDKLPNLKGKYDKTLIGASLIGGAIIIGLVVLGLL
jgi:hypothetical protein